MTGEAGGESSSFGRLHEKVQRWIWQKGWEDLRDIQERSIPLLIEADRDLIIAASTASGKTEAAFLPIVSRLAWDGFSDGFAALYIGPLRALINDQFGRLESLCDDLEIPVTKWHGDVSAGTKAKAVRKPQGILLITPESLEAMFVRRGAETVTLFRKLRYLVIDELHAFMGAPRGKQLQSLMHRIDTAAGRRIPRVGLSATLASMTASATFLRPLDPRGVAILESKSTGQEVQLQLRGYISPRQMAAKTEDDKERVDPAVLEIAKHVYRTLRGGRGLLFAGSRNRVELFTVLLNELTEADGVPEEFFAHHGSLSRDFREEAEQRMKREDLPASIVCTTTLELGIDIGHIDSVAQLGPGHTVSGMRQRLGRSGRRPGKSSVMRIYVEEEEFGKDIHPLDALRRQTVQAVAMVNLMLAKWNEPAALNIPHFSTCAHQVLALIMQHGGVTAKYAWAMLAESGVFDSISLTQFKALLRRMAEVNLLEQAPDGTLLPGEEGERLTTSRDFYAVFHTPEEYRVISDKGRPLGTLPIEHPYLAGDFIIFGGRRWRIVEIDPEKKEIVLTKAFGGQPPRFGGNAMPPADGVIAEMRRIYEAPDVPRYLDETAVSLLQEGRSAYDRYDLKQRSHIRLGDTLLLMPWVGPTSQLALLLALAGDNLEPMPMGLAIGIKLDQETVMRRALERLAASAPPDPLELAQLIEDKLRDKLDLYLGDDLLSEGLARALNVDAVPVLADRLRASMEREEADLGHST